jgi:hypothetical protein
LKDNYVRALSRTADANVNIHLFAAFNVKGDLNSVDISFAEFFLSPVRKRLQFLSHKWRKKFYYKAASSSILNAT